MRQTGILFFITRSKPAAFEGVRFQRLSGYGKDGGIEEESSRDLGCEV
jgi:hypothetical protein